MFSFYKKLIFLLIQTVESRRVLHQWVSQAQRTVPIMFCSIRVAEALEVGNKTYEVQVLQLCTDNILHPLQDQHILSFQQLHLLLSLHLFSPPLRGPYNCLTFS